MSRVLFVVVSILAVAAVVRLASERGEVRNAGRHAPRAQAAAPSVEVSSGPAAPMAATPVAAAPVTTAVPAEDLCASLRYAIAARNSSDIEAKIDELLALINGDVERALGVVDSLSTETDPDLLYAVANALARDARIADARELVEAFLGMALRDPLPNRRMAALAFLGERSRGEAMEAQFLAIALGDPDSLVRTEAVYALERQASLAPEGRKRLNATLLRAAVSSDACVRAPAVGALSMRELDDSQLSSVIGLLREDNDVAVRITAAEKLGEVRAAHRARVMRELEETYVRDADKDVRHTAILSLVAAGRTEALPVLRRLVGVDPALDPVVERFARVLATGEVDLETIFEETARLEAAMLPPSTSPVNEHAPCCNGHE